MNSLVLELQSSAWNSEEKVTALVRKSLVVANKLGIRELEDWAKAELFGYNENTIKIPQYRYVTGRVEAYNRYHGWKKLHFESDDIEDNFSTRILSQPISELDELYKVSNSRDLTMPFSSEISTKIYQSVGHEAVLKIASTEIFRIIEIVKSKILDWSLKLENDGILGANMTFTKEEKQIASQQNYITYIQNMSNSQYQQGTNSSSQKLNNGLDMDELKNILEMVSANLSNLNLDKINQLLISDEVEKLNSEINSNMPKRNIIQSTLTKIGGIIGTVSENALSNKLTELINSFLNGF